MIIVEKEIFYLKLTTKGLSILLAAFIGNNLLALLGPMILESRNGSFSQSRPQTGIMVSCLFFLRGKEEGKQNKMKNSTYFVRELTLLCVIKHMVFRIRFGISIGLWFLYVQACDLGQFTFSTIKWRIISSTPQVDGEKKTKKETSMVTCRLVRTICDK